MKAKNINKTFAFLLCLMYYLSSQSQTTQTWYDFLNSNIRAEGEYVIKNPLWIDPLSDNQQYILSDEQGNPLYLDIIGNPAYHRPFIYIKPNNKYLLIWEDSRKKISNIEFDDIDIVASNTIRVRMGNKFGVIDTNGEFIFKPEYAVILELDPVINVENQLFYLAQDSSGAKNHLWEIRNRNGDLIFDGSNQKCNPFLGSFSDVTFLFFSNKVHYAITVRRPGIGFWDSGHLGPVLSTAVGEINMQPAYIVKGELQFYTFSFQKSTEPLASFNSYIALDKSELEQKCLQYIEWTTVPSYPLVTNRVIYNDSKFFNLRLGKEFENGFAFAGLQDLDIIFPIYESKNYVLKRYYVIGKCDEDYELERNDYSYCDNWQYALVDSDLNVVIPFSNLKLDNIQEEYNNGTNFKQRSILDHFIKTLQLNANSTLWENTRKSCGLFHLEYGTILDPEYEEIQPLIDIYRPVYDGKFWEVELKSGFKKVYNFEKRAFVLEGKEFDDIIARRMNEYQKFYGVLDGVEFEIF